MGIPKTKPKSLSEFVLYKKRVGCKVCQLSPAITEEIKGSRSKKIGRAVVLEWLQREHGIKLTGAELDSHYSGRHENG